MQKFTYNLSCEIVTYALRFLEMWRSLLQSIFQIIVQTEEVDKPTVILVDVFELITHLLNEFFLK